MNSRKILGGLCLMVMVLSLFAWPGQVAGVMGHQPMSLAQREPTTRHLQDRDLFNDELPPGRKLVEDSFYENEENRDLKYYQPEGRKLSPYHFELPEYDGSNTSNRTRGTCTVSSTADSGAGTLRDCLANAVAGDVITFNPTYFPPGSPQTIYLTSDELPWINNTNNLTIDASNAGVILDGSAISGDAIGLAIWGAQGVTVRGLQILNFTLGVLIGNGASFNTIGGDRGIGAGPLGQGNRISGNADGGVWLQSVGTSNNTIRGNLIGTDLSGNAALGNGKGVFIGFGASQNVIGGDHSSGACDGACNLISGNQVGIQIQESASQNNQVLGNFIGTNLQGNSANPNSDAGIIIWDASENHVGGAGSPGVCDGPCNLISGNLKKGIAIQGMDSNNNLVQGNFIGTAISGTAPLPNYDGLIIADGSGNQIGGAGAGEGNLISGNTNYGIWISGEETTDNQVMGNRIGTDISGFSDVPNYEGILIAGSPGNQIGGSTAGAGNLISGNSNTGISLEYVQGIIIAGNKIGTNLSGTDALPNYYGIRLVGGGGHTIGGTSPGAGNLISGNFTSGIHIDTSSANLVQGNTIGADHSGSSPVPNETGIFIGFGASNNLIGGANSGMGNLISGNTWDGVWIQNEISVGNQVLGNRIGTDRSGTSALANEGGIRMIGARETIIGGADLSTPWVCDGPCNLISGNTLSGIHNQGVGAGDFPPPGTIDQNNHVLGNFIGTDLSGTSSLPNSSGVSIYLQAGGNLIGGGSALGEGNLISGNQIDGVVIGDLWSNDNQVSGNRIGTTADGDASLANGQFGIFILEGASGNQVGGESPGLGNLISGNVQEGVWLDGEGTTNNQILNNRIGTNSAGTSALPNYGGIGVVYLASDTSIQHNIISGNLLEGVYLSESTGNQIFDNHIGVGADGNSPLPNGEDGIVVNKAPFNTIGPGNTIAHNLYGLSILEPESIGNTITRNSIYANALKQIGFFYMPIPLPAPMLMGWNNTTNTVTGTACGGCQVEVFANPTAAPGGRTYLGTTTATADNSFSLTIGAGYIYLTATATDDQGTTSAFSDSFQISEENHLIYLPLILQSMSPLPAPILDDISNPDGSSSYTISWSSSAGATSYTLQEDDNNAFSSPITVYEGPSTSINISDKQAGTYYYRVRGSNSSGSSAWSNVRSVTVSETLPESIYFMVGEEDEYYVIYSGLSVNATAHMDYPVTQVQTLSYLTSLKSVIFTISIKHNGTTVASWTQSVNHNDFRLYEHSKNVSFNIKEGDMLTYHITCSLQGEGALHGGSYAVFYK